MKFISMSLWGEAPRFCQGAVQYAWKAREVYPQWRMIVYHDMSVPEETLKELRRAGVLLRDASELKVGKMMWRFLVNDEREMERFIVRDADDRPTAREARMVGDWIISGKAFHVIRDHKDHVKPIMGGMWGCVRGFLPNMAGLMRTWRNPEQYGYDEEFLKSSVWSKAQQSLIEHDVNKGQIEASKNPLEHVGGVYNEKNEAVAWTPAGQEIAK